MNVIYTVLVAFALGYFIKDTRVAVALYLAGEALVFGFQSASLIIEWASGTSTAAFGAFPDHSPSNVWGYGVVNLVITVIGIGLVMLGARTARRRAAKQDVVTTAGV